MAKLPVPFFPEPPKEYNRTYLSQIVRSFSIYTRQLLSPIQLFTKTDAASAASDGVVMWDAVGGYPVVSLDGEWRQLVIANGFAFLTQDADITAAASDTAYPIVFDAPATGYADGISLGAAPNQSRIIFEEGGLYYLTFTAQIFSTNSSQSDFYFWPRLNGTDVPEGATLASTHNNGQTTPVTKGAIFSVSAGDYLEAYWATSAHTNSFLKAFAATAFAPAAPSVSLSITRIRA
jgi:hypothetical protein